MRIRTIKPEFWQNEKMASLPPMTQLLAIGLLNYADDDGYFVNSPALIRAAVFPFQENSRNIPVMLRELSGIGFLALGKDKNGKDHGHVVNFKVHQQINKYRASTVQGFTVDSGSPTGTLPESYRNATGGNGMEWNGSGNGMDQGMEQGKENTPILKDTPNGVVSHPGGVCETKQKKATKAFVAPTVQEVQAYAGDYIAEKRLVNCGFSPEQFVAFYDANGWKVGRNAMKDWRAAVRTWLIKDAYRAGKTGELASVKSEREFVL